MKHQAHLLEVGKKAFPSPSSVPQLFPSIKVRCRASGPAHAIRDGTASNDSALADPARLAIEELLGSCRDALAVRRGRREANVTGRDNPALTSVELARLDHEDSRWRTVSDVETRAWIMKEKKKGLLFLSSLRRLATTKPERPPPTTM